MKGVELYGQVRRAVYVEGMSRREAARRFGIDPRTVAKMLAFSVPPGYRRSQRPARDFVQRTFPDFSNQIEEVISEGDKAFARLTYRGTHRGELFDIAATGKRIQYAGAAVFRFRGDKIAEVWVLGDIYGLICRLQAPYRGMAREAGVRS
jgi:predicted ester cyclase